MSVTDLPPIIQENDIILDEFRHIVKRSGIDILERNEQEYKSISSKIVMKLLEDHFDEKGIINFSYSKGGGYSRASHSRNGHNQTYSRGTGGGGGFEKWESLPFEQVKPK